MSFYTVDKPGQAASIISLGDVPYIYRVKSVLNTHLHRRQCMYLVHLSECLHE